MKFDPKTTIGSQLFSVPNTPEGQKFLADVQKYLNKKRYSIRSRGRGSRKTYKEFAGWHNAQAGVPVGFAEYLVSYLTTKPIPKKKDYAVKQHYLDGWDYWRSFGTTIKYTKEEAQSQVSDTVKRNPYLSDKLRVVELF